MNKIIPIFNVVASIAALILSVCGIAFAVASGVTVLLLPFGIVLTVLAFIFAVVSCGMGFAFVKSKLCITAGIIGAVAGAISIASFIIMI